MDLHRPTCRKQAGYFGIGEGPNKPKMTDKVHTSAEGVPMVAAPPPIEKRTSAGTPLATQNASFQV